MGAIVCPGVSSGLALAQQGTAGTGSHCLPCCEPWSWLNRRPPGPLACQRPQHGIEDGQLGLLVGSSTSQQRGSVSQGRIIVRAATLR